MSDEKLTPLTDPSVRGVLVDDGEPRVPGRDEQFLSLMSQDRILYTGVGLMDGQARQCVKLRPASDFWVAGGERIKELEAEVERLEQCIEVYERSCTQWAEQCNGLIAERDAAQADAERLLNAIAEALAFPEIKDRTIENAVSNLLQRFDLFKATHNAHLKDKDERIKELEAERERLTKDNARWEEACGLASESAGACRVDAERLRKAIETHRRNTEHGWHASDFTDEDRELWSALSPSPAAKENDMESAWLLETTIGNSPVWYTIHHKCGRVFTTDAYHAEHFKSKEAAEAFAAALKLDGWKATEHGFD